VAGDGGMVGVDVVTAGGVGVGVVVTGVVIVAVGGSSGGVSTAGVGSLGEAWFPGSWVDSVVTSVTGEVDALGDAWERSVVESVFSEAVTGPVAGRATLAFRRP
jgi:hypothetical protein